MNSGCFGEEGSITWELQDARVIQEHFKLNVCDIMQK